MSNSVSVKHSYHMILNTAIVTSDCEFCEKKPFMMKFRYISTEISVDKRQIRYAQNVQFWDICHFDYVFCSFP